MICDYTHIVSAQYTHDFAASVELHKNALLEILYNSQP